MIYTHSAIKRGNRVEDEDENHNKRNSTVIIKVLRFSHKRENKLGPRLVWIVFFNIANMYHNFNNEEQDSYLLPLARADEKEDGTVKERRHKIRDIVIGEARHSIQDIIQFPKDILDIKT